MTQDLPIEVASPTYDDRTRLFKSLARVVLIASAGFALIFLFFGSLPYITLHWLGTLPPAETKQILSMMTILVRFSPSLGACLPR